MRVLTCFKVVPDLEMLTEEDWRVDDNQIDVSFVKTELNCFDESALEITLKLSDVSESFNVNFHKTGLSIGDSHIDIFLRKLLALRFDQAVRIDTADDLRFTPHRVAELIAAYVKQNPQDVLILGRQSSVGDNAQTPLILAELLGWPCITQVVKVELDSQDFLCVTNQQDDGMMQQAIETPCVLAIGNAQITTMRVPTLKDKMAYGKRPIDVIPAEELSTPDKGAAALSKNHLLKLENVDNQRAGVIISQGSLEEKAQYLYDHYLKERLQKL